MRKRKLVSKAKIGMAGLLLLILVTVISLAPRGPILIAYAEDATHSDKSALVVELRRNTQMLLDAIAPGDVAVWDKLLDPAALQTDENDVVRRKPEILAELKPWDLDWSAISTLTLFASPRVGTLPSSLTRMTKLWITTDR